MTEPRYRAGISGIQKEHDARQKRTDKNISVAFQDLKQLMQMAEEMVVLSKSVAQKIADKKGELSEDETVKLRSHLLSLGVSDNVNRKLFSSEDNFYLEMAKLLVKVLLKPIQEQSGMMLMTDAYCRINRALGMELLSPDDLINACAMLAPLELPLRLRVFESQVKVIELASHDVHQEALETQKMIETKGLMTADELSSVLSIAVVLAKERLLFAEKQGLACRDDCIEGLIFYPNLFLTIASD